MLAAREGSVLTWYRAPGQEDGGVTSVYGFTREGGVARS